MILWQVNKKVSVRLDGLSEADENGVRDTIRLLEVIEDEQRPHWGIYVAAFSFSLVIFSVIAAIAGLPKILSLAPVVLASLLSSACFCQYLYFKTYLPNNLSRFESMRKTSETSDVCKVLFKALLKSTPYLEELQTTSQDRKTKFEQEAKKRGHHFIA